MSEELQALTTTTERMVAFDTYSPVELQARLADMAEEARIIQRFFREVMVKDHDYGVIPGTPKPTLLKPGAEKLAEYYGYAPTVRAVDEDADRETGFYRARVTVALVSKRTGVIVGEGIGEANTREGRYRWRDAKRTCPSCGATAIIKGKEEFGGGWVCFRKQGGCGATYRDNDAAITAQPVGRVENDDPFALWNTVLKMAKKRALIDAVLSATRSSGLFTQDVEDLEDWVGGEVVERPTAVWSPPAKRPGPATPPARPVAGRGREAESGRALRQYGRFVGRDGKPDWQAFLAAVEDATLTLDHVAAVTGLTEDNRPAVTAWLGDNPDKTLHDLIEMAVEQARAVKEA